MVYVYISQVEPTYFFDGHAFIDHKNGKLMHSKVTVRMHESHI